jgi:hypothetical protein
MRTPRLLQLPYQLGFQGVRIRNHFAGSDLFISRPVIAKLADSQATFRSYGRTKGAASHRPRVVESAQSGLRIEHRARLVIGKFREAFFRLRTFIEHARLRIAGKLCRQALNRISRPIADPPRPLRVRLFQVSQSPLQPQRIQLIDGKRTDTALRASGTTHQPLAATARSIGQSRVDDLDQDRIRGWQSLFRQSLLRQALFRQALFRHPGSIAHGDDKVLAMKHEKQMPEFIACLLVLLCAAGSARAQAVSQQTETDEYTRYELLSPASASFAIRYEVTATTDGAKYFFNPIRKGSVASGESVMDVMTGQPLRFEVVSGEQAVTDPFMKGEDTSVDYIKVYLARPVPPGGQARLLILKTYKDAKSYYRDGDAIVFNRPLGIPRNSIVLPAGYEVVSCNIPSQVVAELDGRIGISFMNGSGAEAPVVVKAKPGAQTGATAAPRTPGSAKSWESPFEGETEQERLAERAHQDREIVYFLQQPETHAFRLYHDYTESKPGADRYFNVVRSGSKVSDPSAYVLDTGEKLATKIMTGAKLTAAKIDAGEPVDAAAQVVVIPFSPVKAGQNIRVRISETYTAPASYRLEGDELVFDRSLGRPRNAVVLPDGWYLTASSIPATITQMADGRVRLDFWNGNPAPVDVLIKAKRRAQGH